jgi:enoyl-CoA hydratase/carnithine racemase
MSLGSPPPFGARTTEVRYEVRERVATVTLDGPASKNALGPSEWSALSSAITRAGDDPEVRVVVLTGAGGVFSAGGDVRTMPERLALAWDKRRDDLLADAQLVVQCRALAKPILAMIDGPAVGAGLSLALACDVCIASERARFGAVFHRVGLTGDFGLTWLLPRVVGPARALDLVMSAELIDAARAERIGLVARVVPPERLVDETYAYARRLAEGPPIAIALTKRALHEALERSLTEALRFEADAQATCSKTADAAEGVRAFLEKRKPSFRGR